MRDLPITEAEQHFQCLALGHFRRLDRSSHADLPIVGRAITEIECVFMLDGPPDRSLCAALRTHLEGAALAPAASAFQQIVTRRVAMLPGSEEVLLTVCEALERSWVFPELRPSLQRWALVTAYASLVAYGPVGALLPPAPKGIRDDIGYVPGPRHPHRDGETSGGHGTPTVTIVLRGRR